jgi:hypothetical protein
MLRKLLVLLGALFALLAWSLVPTAYGEDDDGDDDGGGGSTILVDFTAGSGTATFGVGATASFDFDVQSGPTGPIGGGSFTNVSGTVFTGPATCLRVDGNLAVFEIDNQNPNGQDLEVFVGDFGPFGMDDQINFGTGVGVADANCPDPKTIDEPLIVGDIVVGSRPGDGDDDDGDDDDGDDDDDD